MAEERDENNHLVVDPIAFPSGMKALGDFIHSKGLLFGLYQSAGIMTCAKRAGSLGNEKIDAEDMVSWGMDYLKYDNCHNMQVDPEIRYLSMQQALNKTGRPVLYSLCNWGEN